MRHFQRLIHAVTAVLFCAGLLSACNTPQAAVPTLIPAPTLTSVPSASPLPVLTDAVLLNGTYKTPQYGKTVTFKDGKYEGGTGADYLSATLLHQIGRGDLNGDGLEDAVLLMAENAGGSGVFVSLVGVLNQDGKPVQVGQALIDDRAKINSVEIKDGKILLDGVIHGVNDPMVSPTLGVVEMYQLVNKILTLVRFSSTVKGGAENSIHIETPANGATVSGSVQVKGSMPIGPFENNLTYRILDENGNKVTEGPFMVKSDGLGAPATFDNPIDLSSVAPGTKIRLELVDVSAADGSTRALDSVELQVK